MKLRYIRIFLCIVGLSFFTLGCAYFNERMDAAEKCANDPACVASIKSKSAIAKALGDSSGFPWAGPAASVALTGIMLFFAKKRKEEK